MSPAAISTPISGLPTCVPSIGRSIAKVFLQNHGRTALVPGLIKPVGLMAADYPEIRERVFQRFPFMRSSAFERRMLFQRAGERQSSPRTS